MTTSAAELRTGSPLGRLASRPPTLPRGTFVPVRGGRTFVREVPGPAHRPTVLLVHGWVATGALNWYQAFGALQGRYRVLAVDVRGHGRGLRTRRIFRLADCADDAAEVVDALDAGPVIAVGYSMGGPIAQLFWHRHRDLCAGLVLCATANGFMPVTRDRIVFSSMMAAAVGTTRLGGVAARVPGLPDRVRPILARTTGPGTMPHWAAREFRRHDWRMVTEAGHSLATYHARWLPDVDVPTSVVLTTKDQAVAPRLQEKMARAIEGATIHEVADGHIACAKPAFARPLVAAIDDVAARLSR